MKKIVAVLLLVLAWYFAGMNRQPYVMAAVICGIIFIVLSFILTRILKRDLTAEIPKQNTVIYKNMQAQFTVCTRNRSRLPVNKYKLTLQMNYRDSKDKAVKKLSGSACPAGSEGDNSAEVYFAAPYCGMIDAELLRLRVYDYFMIFSSSKKLSGVKGEVAVLPPPRKMNIVMPPFGTYTNDPVAESTSDKKGEDHSEVRLIREYRDGDLPRHIHRNYSAKTEKLWIKEYEKENDYIFDLFIDSSSETRLTVEQKDAFFELIFAVIKNLMENDIIIRINYFDREKGGLILYELTDKNNTEDFMIDLYKADIFCGRDEFLRVCNLSADDNVMVLNASLEWYFCGRPVYRFSRQSIYYELVDRYFDLSAH